MENTTTRLAVQIQNHPPFPFSWDDSTPQKSRSELKEEDILPNEDDGHHLHQQMMNVMMEFPVKELKSLSDHQFLPSKQCPPAHKSVVMPMKLLFWDEKYTDENIAAVDKRCKFGWVTTGTVTHTDKQFKTTMYNRRPGNMQNNTRCQALVLNGGNAPKTNEATCTSFPLFMALYSF